LGVLWATRAHRLLTSSESVAAPPWIGLDEVMRPGRGARPSTQRSQKHLSLCGGTGTPILRAEDKAGDDISRRLVHRRQCARVGVEGEGHSCVSKPFTHHLRRHTRGQPCSRIGMAQVVQSDGRQASSARMPAKPQAEPVRVNRRAVRHGEDQTSIHIVGARQQALLSLALSMLAQRRHGHGIQRDRASTAPSSARQSPPGCRPAPVPVPPGQRRHQGRPCGRPPPAAVLGRQVNRERSLTGLPAVALGPVADAPPPRPSGDLGIPDQPDWNR
jgi:hypothetical protein